MEQRVIISTQLESELASALSECEHDKLFVLTDTTTLELCMPVLRFQEEAARSVLAR